MPPQRALHPSLQRSKKLLLHMVDELMQDGLQKNILNTSYKILIRYTGYQCDIPHNHLVKGLQCKHRCLEHVHLILCCWKLVIKIVIPWVRRWDLHPRPSAYETDELTNCYHSAIYWCRRRESNPQNTVFETAFYANSNTSTCGRDDRIRTCGILLPKQARYQTAPRPDNKVARYFVELAYPLAGHLFNPEAGVVFS